MKFKLFILSIFISVCFLNSNAQISEEIINVWQCEIHYSYHIPGGDMAERFGNSSMIGVGVTYKMKTNWTLGFETNYLFGSNIKNGTSILEHLMTDSEQIINRFGEYGNVILSERGFYSGLKVGRVFPVIGPNQNSGIVFNVGAGLLQHHIRIENKDNNTPPVLGDYKKGYDRLSNGLALRQFIGYQNLGNNKTFNYYFGFEFYQAWTQCRRDFNFDTMERDDTQRHDFLFGIKAGWILPIYKRNPEKYYYN